MKKPIVILALLMSAPASAAEWQHLFTSSGMRVFIDTASIDREGGYKKATVMRDFMQPQSGKESAEGFQSAKDVFLFSCGDKKMGLKSFLLYREKMGKGIIIDSYTAESVPMKAIIPGSRREVIFKRVCK